MKRLILMVLILGLFISPVYGASEWAKGEVKGTRNVSDIDLYMQTNNEAIDRMTANYRHGAKITYASAATLTVGIGEVMCSNAAGTLRKMRKNTAAVTVAWTEIDTGAEASSTTYYLYAVADADSENFTVIISANSSTPQGGESYYKRLGSFYNNGSGDIEQIVNDNTYMTVASGTVANAGTIAIPSGYSSSQCDWTIGGNSQVQTDADGESSTGLTVTVSASRVVACTVTSSASTATYGATCSTNYMIVCYK